MKSFLFMFTVDWEYFVSTKLAWAKCSMRFNFVELHAHEVTLTAILDRTCENDEAHFAKV